MMKAAKPSVEQTVTRLLCDHPDATAAEITTTGQLGRSIVSKVLVKLRSVGKVKRTLSGRRISKCGSVLANGLARGICPARQDRR